VSSVLDTPLGNRADVEAYRTQLNSVIDFVNGVQAQVQEQAVGSANVATAENLSAAYSEVRPRLLEALVELDRMVPPLELASLHQEVRLLMVLRIDAQELVIDGFASGDGETMYAQAESKLAAANALVASLNARLCDLDRAIGGLDGDGECGSEVPGARVVAG
jgi:hypothetical protein